MSAVNAKKEFDGKVDAATVVWMCSDAAGFMVGHALVVDGGQTIA
jgi:hypothetical protein